MKLWLWILSKFWWLWGANAILAAVVLLIFFSGLVSGWVGSHNLLPWCGILLLGVGILGGSRWLWSNGHPNLALLPLLLIIAAAVLTVGGSLLFFAFYLLVYSLGNGRMN